LNTGRACEAWFYAGIKRLAAGDKRTAIELFKKCLATDQKTFVEFGLAATELNMLGDNQRAGNAPAVRNALQP
jgi:lipoprotein NlpI